MIKELFRMHKSAYTGTLLIMLVNTEALRFTSCSLVIYGAI